MLIFMKFINSSFCYSSLEARVCLRIRVFSLSRSLTLKLSLIFKKRHCRAIPVSVTVPAVPLPFYLVLSLFLISFTFNSLILPVHMSCSHLHLRHCQFSKIVGRARVNYKEQDNL